MMLTEKKFSRLLFKPVLLVLLLLPPPRVHAQNPTFVLIPAGSFEMGDHHGFVDPNHGPDEIPIHTVTIDAFCMEATKVTCLEYADYLNSAYAQGLIEVRSGFVYGVGGSEIYCDTTASDPASPIEWTGSGFTIVTGRDLHPVTGIRWFGAIACCNWMSARDGLSPCYDLTTGDCDFSKVCYRLPTEAEWEYAARGGQYNPYFQFPWGDDKNLDGTLANWPASGDPYETGPNPWTTPVGFYDGTIHNKADFGWPGSQDTYQTRDNSNPWGLYDMSGNAWEWVNDWYDKDYYQFCVDNNIVANPRGPATGSPMPDGKPYRGLRGGNWYNGQNMYGHGRVANRDPSYYRGPGDPNGPWFHIGFRVIRTDTSCEAGYRILRHEVSNLSDPLSLHLPLDPTRDLFQTTAANPFVVTGDVTPTAAPLIFYEVVAAPLVRLGKEGTDVALNF